MHKRLEDAEEMKMMKASGYKFMVKATIKPNTVPGSEFVAGFYDIIKPTNKEIENFMRKHGATDGFDQFAITEL